MDRSRIVALISVLSIIFSLAGCANQPPRELQDVAAPKENERTGGETTTSQERAILTGVVTEVDREPGGEAPAVRSILVEESPCGEGPADPGCEKIYYRIIDETRVFGEERGREVAVSAGELKKGQRVRVDYTGYPVAESSPPRRPHGRS